VLDEPTEGLDPIWRLRLRDLITQLRKEGRTLLIASHDLGEVERFVDTVVLLDAGTVKETIPIARSTDSTQRYRIFLRAPVEQAAQIFQDIDDPTARVLHVTVLGADDLSARLAALLAAGGIVESVMPAGGLEERVRAALGEQTR
jgi:ABC-type multidrug transport system ATPase subunit